MLFKLLSYNYLLVGFSNGKIFILIQRTLYQSKVIYIQKLNKIIINNVIVLELSTSLIILTPILFSMIMEIMSKKSLLTINYRPISLLPVQI